MPDLDRSKFGQLIAGFYEAAALTKLVLR